ncbi:hypothetical protein RIF29_35328 [Crotalaria pallida]|uniref:Receptor-like serine/threonine-protein kinase n=1 Tax=Crotalaria pallida TaxID=3830 RepID=A0AAN9HXW1_CROPI
MAISTLHLFLTLILLPIHLVFGNNITLNSTLSTNDKNPAWLSSSGEFAFGFYQINDTEQNHNNLFLLAIWYNKIPDKTIVWNARTGNPVPKGSTVQLTATGLTLSNPQGEAIWKAEPPESETVSYGAMLDTGNFVLASTDSSSTSPSTSTYVWESFKNPTDTLLPGQNLNVQGTLTSRLTESNYTKGRFQLYFDNGNMFLNSIGWPDANTDSRYTSYFRVNSNDSTSQLVFDSKADIYVEILNGEKISLGWGGSALDPNAYYYRATLDFYGVFTQYAHPKGSGGQQGWSIVRYVPDDICFAITSDLGSGSCGYNSYCSMENQRPNCKCPDGYSLVDPKNQFGGCQPGFSLGCGADDAGSRDRPEEVFEFKVLEDVDWPLSDYERLDNYASQDCQTTCLHDCLCVVAIFVKSSSTCWKKKFPLSYGRSKTDGHVAFIKTRIHSLRDIPLVSPPKGYPDDLGAKKEDPDKPILIGSLVGSLAINSVLLASVILFFLLKTKKLPKAVSVLETNLYSFPYETLKQYTQDFSEELGRGSFGIVYKGTLNSASDQFVAVKKLDRLAVEREKEFRTELSVIGKTSHKNLVRLIGFCDEGTHRLLVYEFMSNGTLADVLFGQVQLDWNTRVAIALGTARGLVYLHEECGTPIIHCDIKPQNVLIDEHFTPKISDFGLAKLLMFDQSKTHTMIRGTRGYVAPEWFKNVPVTAKVDVYSFGVMLLEIICCRRCVLELEQEEKVVLIDWAYDCLWEGRVDALVEGDNVALADKIRLKKWVMIAMWCIQEHPEMRPTMKTAMHMLEGVVEVPNLPSPSSFTLTS